MGFGSKDEWCGSIVKYSMFLSNFIIFIGGIVLVAISVYTLYDKSFIKELLGTNLFTGAVYILIVAGILLSLLSFLGCAGAVKEVKCMLLTYFIILFIIFIVMLVGGILCYVFRQRVQTTMQQEMLRTISYIVVESRATMTGGSTGLAESFPAAVVKRSTERNNRAI
ncbi:unnamed protein product [Macrosiphum euphorbiae]|uniref:Tetraspanin n=1 Tax=Macrosiphum euphorbiae TaxID=13131 RepID=A0AAV0X9N7_9HEMI|nr:unnamed protein product [Macrosiphum euphorbiae]